MQKGQGALEYLIVIAAVLAIAAVVVFFITGAFGTQREQASFAACKEAAVSCKNARLLTPNDPCNMCEQACIDMAGNDIMTGTSDFGEGSAVWYCKQGRPQDIYERAPSVCGNEVKETGETCDSDSVDCSTLGNYESGTSAQCKTDCSGYNTAVCTALPNQLPIASFTIHVEGTPTSFEATFDASASSDPDGTIVSWSWDFGDGSTGNGVTVTHTYTAEGPFVVSLTVTDDRAATGNKIAFVNGPQPYWHSERVDTTLYAGWALSLAVGSDDVSQLSYYDTTNGRLRYAKRVDGVWDIQTVDSGYVGNYNSIAVDSSNNPHISYYTYSGKDLKYAKWTGSGWDIEYVEITADDVGKYLSMALDSNDRPHISYYDTTNKAVKYARYTGSGWDIKEVADTGDPGMSVAQTSIAVDSENIPHIVYKDYTSGYLVYAKWTGSAWDKETIVGNVGNYLSIALDSGDVPHIAFTLGGALKYAKKTDTGWDVKTVDDEGDQMGYVSIAIDSSDAPHISYNRDAYTSQGRVQVLRYAKWVGEYWQDWQIYRKIEDGGFYTSIAIDSNNYPRIAYYDSTENLLEYAYFAL